MAETLAMTSSTIGAALFSVCWRLSVNSVDEPSGRPTRERFRSVSERAESTSVSTAFLVATVFTERDIYRPGEPVYAKLIVRTGPLGALTVPRADSAKLIFHDREGGEIRASVLRLSEFGTAADSIRLPADANHFHFHAVEINDYGLFRYPDYTLPLSVKMAEVSRDCGLDVLHVHYAVPHATAAILARSMLPPHQRPRVVTTMPSTAICWTAYEASKAYFIRRNTDGS